MKPEMEHFEWVVIRHPELASSSNAQSQEEPASSEGQNSENNGLQQPEKPAGDLSPFLSARHFNLTSKNTSMFMAGNFDSIIVGEWKILYGIGVYLVILVPFLNVATFNIITNIFIFCNIQDSDSDFIYSSTMSTFHYLLTWTPCVYIIGLLHSIWILLYVNINIIILFYNFFFNIFTFTS